MKKIIFLVVVACHLISCASSYDAKQYPLHAAAYKGDAQQVKEALNSGCPINIHDKDGFTPLLVAAYYGHWGIVKEFVKMGAEVNVQDSGGMTPLHCAVSHNKQDMVNFLLDHGAQADIQDSSGHTPLAVAASGGQWGMVRNLAEVGAGTNAPDSYGMTPLLHAVNYCQPDMVSFLVEKGAQTVVATQDGLTPIHYVVLSCSEKSEKALSIINALLESGCDISALDSNGHTAYWTAMDFMFIDMIALLRKKGVKERYRGGSASDFDEKLRSPSFFTPPDGAYLIPEGREIYYKLAIEDCNHLVVPYRKNDLLFFGPIAYGVGLLKDKNSVPAKHNACMEKMGFQRIQP